MTSSRRSSASSRPPTLAEVKAEQARRSLAEFARQAWPLVEPGAELHWNWHLDAMAEHLQAVTAGKIRHLLITVPPGLMKSLMVSVFWPAWMWAARPEWRAIFGSYAEPLALRDSVKCRMILDSEWFKSSFVKGQWELAGDQNVKGFYLNTRQGFRISTSVGGTGTGFRASAVVVDDPLSAQEAFSKAARERVIRWWRYTIGNRLSDMRTGVKVVIQQRLHMDDLAGYILKNEPYFEHLNLPMEFEAERRSHTKIGWKDPRKTEGELLFPTMFPREVVDGEKVRLGSYGFAGQHQQRPAPVEGGLFKRAWWKRWRRADQTVPEGMEARLLPDTFDEVLMSVDCTFKDTDGTDYVVMGVVARHGADKYLFDLVRDRMSFTVTLATFLDFSTKWPEAVAKLVEDKANGPAVIDVLRGKVPGIIAIEPQGSKLARAAAGSPEVEAGNVYLPMDAPWVHDFIEEHANFPNGANDDQVDMLSQALTRMRTHSEVMAVVDTETLTRERQWD